MTPSDSPGPKIGGTCKQCAIIFYGGRVIANFVPKFVAMAYPRTKNYDFILHIAGVMTV